MSKKKFGGWKWSDKIVESFFAIFEVIFSASSYMSTFVIWPFAFALACPQTPRVFSETLVCIVFQKKRVESVDRKRFRLISGA